MIAVKVIPQEGARQASPLSAVVWSRAKIQQTRQVRLLNLEVRKPDVVMQTSVLSNRVDLLQDLAQNERKPEEARQEEQNQGPGQGQGQRERNKPSKQTTMERVSTRRKGKRERRQRKRITSAVNRRFTSLVQGATETDLCLLLDESSWRNDVYNYDHEAKRCVACESVPWPVAWVLGRFNLKHRHLNKPPSAESVRECCVDLERKVLWRWHRDTK